MDMASIQTLFGESQLAMLLSALALIVALLGFLATSAGKRRNAQETEALRQKANALGREVDDLRVHQFNAPQSSSQPPTTTDSDCRYLTEKAAYEQIWPQVWQLHDSLGLFLRAIENRESAGDLRLEARNAALEARQLLNHNRPFCDQEVEGLITRLIDTEIKAHLAACQYLDMLKEATGGPSEHDRRVLQDKCHALYDGEARELMNRLVEAIRQRMLSVSYS
ncbi:hypothetical protein FWJ25_03535 [Marinobacter salinexigens]|uniref:Uncharacterized protein n=1 Tax=Marinobacter salinexigens TaxID=2919747 RepID=A0A5B0VNL4_9GAMM|nr:hypothetical protein [Marinobacter salinexigens]KAA1176216.1 hypothetical protein FWJ25_03535 [Marinobacter salinexigens]